MFDPRRYNAITGSISTAEYAPQRGVVRLGPPRRKDNFARIRAHQIGHGASGIFHGSARLFSKGEDVSGVPVNLTHVPEHHIKTRHIYSRQLASVTQTP